MCKQVENLSFLPRKTKAKILQKSKTNKDRKESVQIIKPIIFNTLSQKIDKPKTDKEEKSNEKKLKRRKTKN